MRNFSKALSVVLAFLTVSAAHAVLPPLSQEMRESMSSDIVTGTVIESSSEVIAVRQHMTNMVYRVTLEVTTATKGELKPGQTIEVTYWKAQERPRGYCGHTGQYRAMKEGESVTAYMSRNDDGVYELLEPNGFDVN